jgi:hypothetical protein
MTPMLCHLSDPEALSVRQLRFVDAADLLTQLAEWRTEVNTARPCRAARIIPAVRLAEERSRLRAHMIAPGSLQSEKPR